jgi:uncharacterized protein with PIN domain
MKQASFRFYAELNDFLSESHKQTRFGHTFRGAPAIKDVLEALGAPHTEIDLIIINNLSVGFDYILQHEDRVSVYPRFRNLDIASLTNVRPPPLQANRFVLDMHLGRLAAYLRLLGFDCLYWNQVSDERLARISLEQKRILLTRDRGLLKRNAVTYGYCIREKNPRDQLQEVVERFDLKEHVEPFKRCMRCNGVLESVDKETIIEQLPEGVRANQDEFRICPDCERVYWRGSHFERMQRLINGVIDDLSPAD